MQIRKRRVRVPAFLLLKFLSQTEGSRIARTSRELNCFLAPWPRREISAASMNVSTRVKPHHRTRIENSDFILVTVEIWACRIYPLWRMFRSRILRECLLLVIWISKYVIIPTPFIVSISLESKKGLIILILEMGEKKKKPCDLEKTTKALKFHAK